MSKEPENTPKDETPREQVQGGAADRNQEPTVTPEPEGTAPKHRDGPALPSVESSPEDAAPKTTPGAPETAKADASEEARADIPAAPAAPAADAAKASDAPRPDAKATPETSAGTASSGTAVTAAAADATEAKKEPESSAKASATDSDAPAEREPVAAERAAGAEAAADRAARRRKAGRGTGKRVLAVSSGALLVLATAAAALAPRWIPDPERGDLPVPAARTAAGSSTFVCPPAPARVGQNASSDDAYASGAATASSTLSAAALGDQSQRLPGAALLGAKDRTVKHLSPELSEEKASQAAGRAEDGFSGAKGVTVTKQAADAATWLRVQALGGLRSPGAATRTVNQRSGDLTGLAAPSCSSPANTVWLVGASTTVGHTAVLTVTNPAPTSAAVTVTVMTKDGEATDGAVAPFTLGAGETRSINLGGTARDAGEIAVRVDASGAAVSASVNQSVLRGTTPGGMDTITPSGTASSTQVMTGVRLQDAAASKKVGATDVAGDETPQVQIADLSGEGTTADVVARGSDGKEHRITSGVSVPASSVVSVPLDSLPAGDYTVSVQAKDTVAATARVLRGSDPKKASDVAYIPATDQLSTTQLVATPTAGDGTLVLSAPDDAAKVTVVPVAADGSQGAAKQVQVGAGGTATVALKDLKKPVALELSASGTAYGSVLSTDGSGITSTALPQLPQPPASSRVDLEP